MEKVYVDVIVKYTKEGEKQPLTVIWKDGARYDVDRVIDVRRAASLKAGGQGFRYTCRINGKQTYIWLEDGRWFVEGKPVVKPGF